MVETMELLRSNMPRVRIPGPTSRIYKQECCISFDTPRGEGGLYVDMTTFLAFGKNFVEWNYHKTGNPVYLHIKQIKKAVAEDRPTLLAIGVDGGFDNNETEYEETYHIVILPHYASLPFPSVELPEKVRLAVNAILKAEGAERKEQFAPWTADTKRVSTYAMDLLQIDSGTEMTTAERELDQNTNFDWNRIQESGQEVEPLYGPGYTGLVNLGNSCYLASTMQVVFSTRSFCSRYFTNQSLKEAFETAPADPTVDLNTQLTKLAHGLLSGVYSVPEPKKDIAANASTATPSANQVGIPPRMFKAVIAASNPEFSTMKQQDALEFFRHFLDQVERANAGKPDLDPSRSFKFGIEERISCSSGKVEYNRRLDYILSLKIPLDAATNKEELKAFQKLKEERSLQGVEVSGDEIVRPRVSLDACLATFSAPEEVQVLDIFSSPLIARTTAVKSAGLTSFPDYLVLHMCKFVMEEGSPRKLDVYIDVPDIIDISHMRCKGQQPGEELLPESDINSPISHETQVDLSKVHTLELYGFPPDVSRKAVQASGGDIVKALNWMLNNLVDFGSWTNAAIGLPDGIGKYKLIGLISHIGTSPQCGHYVAHIYKDEKWVIFNDDKVGASINLPKDMGYLYFFERLNSS